MSKKNIKTTAEIVDSWCDVETNKMYILMIVNNKAILIERKLFY